MTCQNKTSLDGAGDVDRAPDCFARQSKLASLGATTGALETDKTSLTHSKHPFGPFPIPILGFCDSATVCGEAGSEGQAREKMRRD